ERAIAEYTRALRLNPYCASTHLRRGDAYRQAGQHERAIADYGHALRLDPLSAEALARRAAALRQLGQHEQALADLAPARGLAARPPPPRRARATRRLLPRRALPPPAPGAPAAAGAKLGPAREACPGNAELPRERGRARRQAGDQPGALEDLDAALGLAP